MAMPAHSLSVGSAALLVLLQPKCVAKPLQHRRSGIVRTRLAVQMPPLKVSNRFQHPTATQRSASPGISLNQFACAASNRIAERTRWTFLGQLKKVLKTFKERRVRTVRPRSAPVIRRRLDSGGMPRVMSAAPEHLATLVAHDVACTEGTISRWSIPRDRMTAGSVYEIREPTA